jgi:hypothetical protein
MADVFVASMTVVAFTAFPAGTRITVQSGYYLFLFSVVAGMMALAVLQRTRTGNLDADKRQAPNQAGSQGQQPNLGCQNTPEYEI